MSKIFATCIFLFFGLLLYSQEPQLTKNQMYADFDELVQIIEECNPQIEVRKIVTGFHQLDTIISLRKNIDTITDYGSFRNLMNLALFYVFDPHSRETYEYYAFDNLKDIDTAEITKRNEYYSSQEYFQNERRKKGNICKSMYFPISPVYLYEDDSYWLLGTNRIVKYDKSDTIFIECMKIISFNDQPFVKYVEENCKDDFRFDYQRLKYYFGGSYGFNLPGNGKLKGMQYGEIIEFNIEDYPVYYLNNVINRNDLEITMSEIPQKPQDVHYDQHNRKVEFFEMDSVLFIYLDQMIVDSAFCNSIKDVAKNKKINKVIIDIRDNFGGNDECWKSVLKAIVKDTLTYNIKLASNNSKMLKNKFKGYNYPNKYERIDWLDNKKFMIFDYKQNIVPDKNSLNYDGKIYVLCNKNTYSAAYSLVNFANQLDQTVTVGSPTGRIEGLGITPPLFQLKNSKFTFRLACTMDIYNCNKAIDVYKDFPEILVFPTALEELIHTRTRYDRKSEEYLRKYDKMFKKVIELN